MYICLSSGATVRYRDDILRSIAMPNGARLQFRYDMQRWVAPIVRDRLEREKTAQGPALICYIDQHDVHNTPELVPCRFARLIEAIVHGSTVTLTLELEEFAYAENLGAFNTELRQLSAQTLPVWQSDGKIKGSYWLDTNQDPSTAIKSAKLAEMEKIVNQLVAHVEFGDETRFYTVLLHSVSTNKSVLYTNGAYNLRPNRDYEMRLYHFSPKTVPAGTIEISSSNELLRFTTSTSLKLDSRYDLKRVGIKTGKPLESESSVLTLQYREKQETTLDIDLQIATTGSFWSTVGKGVLLGTLIAIPQVIAALSNPNLPKDTRIIVIIVSGFFGIAAGLVAAFGLKKSI